MPAFPWQMVLWSCSQCSSHAPKPSTGTTEPTPQSTGKHSRTPYAMLYMDHHSMPNINTPRVPLTQSESIFSSASQEVLSIRLSEEAEAFDSTDSPLMAKGSLSKHDVVGDIDHKFYLAGETKDDFLKRQLRFFVPALVWAYNYLKCSNLQIEADIVLKKSELEMQEWLANRRQGPAPPAPQFPNVMHRFIHGTALERRRSEAEEVDRRRELEEIVHSFKWCVVERFRLEFYGIRRFV